MPIHIFFSYTPNFDMMASSVTIFVLLISASFYVKTEAAAQVFFPYSPHLLYRPPYVHYYYAAPLPRVQTTEEESSTSSPLTEIGSQDGVTEAEDLANPSNVTAESTSNNITSRAGIDWTPSLRRTTLRLRIEKMLLRMDDG